MLVEIWMLFFSKLLVQRLYQIFFFFPSSAKLRGLKRTQNTINYYYISKKDSIWTRS